MLEDWQVQQCMICSIVHHMHASCVVQVGQPLGTGTVLMLRPMCTPPTFCTLFWPVYKMNWNTFHFAKHSNHFTIRPTRTAASSAATSSEHSRVFLPFPPVSSNVHLHVECSLHIGLIVLQNGPIILQNGWHWLNHFAHWPTRFAKRYNHFAKRYNHFAKWASQLAYCD